MHFTCYTSNPCTYCPVSSPVCSTCKLNVAFHLPLLYLFVLPSSDAQRLDRVTNFQCENRKFKFYPVLYPIHHPFHPLLRSLHSILYGSPQGWRASPKTPTIRKSYSLFQLLFLATYHKTHRTKRALVDDIPSLRCQPYHSRPQILTAIRNMIHGLGFLRVLLKQSRQQPVYKLCNRASSTYHDHNAFIIIICCCCYCSSSSSCCMISQLARRLYQTTTFSIPIQNSP